MKDTKGVRQVLAEFGRKCSPVATLRNVDNPLVRPEYIDEAEQELQEIMLGMLPEKKTDVRGTTQNPDNPKYLTKVATGYNKAIELMEQNIRGGFKGE